LYGLEGGNKHQWVILKNIYINEGSWWCHFIGMGKRWIWVQIPFFLFLVLSFG
jgi:hypothetical protein